MMQKVSVVEEESCSSGWNTSTPNMSKNTHVAFHILSNARGRTTVNPDPIISIPNSILFSINSASGTNSDSNSLIKNSAGKGLHLE